MHFLLGLAALLIGVVIAVRRARAGWWVGLVIALAVIGAIFAILGFLRVTDAWGLTVMNVIGWVFVALCFMTALAAIFVLERRGANGEEQDAILGDTPFDGDTNDADDPRSTATAGSGPWATASTVTLAEPAAPVASTPSAAPVEGQVVADELEARESANDSAAPVAPQDGTAVVGADPDLAIPDADAESVDADDDRDVRHTGDADDDRRSDGPQVRF